jgi:hypothetical protein
VIPRGLEKFADVGLESAPGVWLLNTHFSFPPTFLQISGRFAVPLNSPIFLHDPPRLDAFTGLVATKKRNYKDKRCDIFATVVHKLKLTLKLSLKFVPFDYPDYEPTVSSGSSPSERAFLQGLNSSQALLKLTQDILVGQRGATGNFFE